MLIKIVDGVKEYNAGVRALCGVNLEIDSGEFVSIIGRSGSGKSTLLNILGCLDTLSSGGYELEGHNVEQLNDHELSKLRSGHIGFIFQGFNLIPALTAQENVELALSYRGINRVQRKRAAKQALESVGLSGREEHLPCELSGGQQQRVAIARAVAAKPPIILADEPTGNLDERSGKEVMDILEDLNRGGATVIVITHDAATAKRAERIIRISDGRIKSDLPN